MKMLTKKVPFISDLYNQRLTGMNQWLCPIIHKECKISQHQTSVDHKDARYTQTRFKKSSQNISNRHGNEHGEKNKNKSGHCLFTLNKNNLLL